MEQIDEKMWREIENVILRMGTQNQARKIRHLYMLDMTDDQFERMYTIVTVHIRQAMDKVYEKYDVDPEMLREAPKSPPKGRKPRLGTKPVNLKKPRKLAAVDGYEIVVDDE